ncbi:MAG: hypothetical protein AB7G15_05455 [Alphaproteobacteria bacterium]
MFKDLFKRKAKPALADKTPAGEQMGVFSLELAGVADPFDPDPLWDRKYGGNSEIVERATEDKEFRLQAALDGCRDVKFVRDEHGRFREQTPVFTDIVMWIPEAKWRHDSLHGGHRLEALATNLAALHKRKFSRSLPGDREPIYCIMPDGELTDNAVIFQFGFGVFVPGEKDQLLGTVALRRNKTAQTVKVPDYSFWRGGKETKRPVGVFQGQGSLLITPDRTGPARAPLWFREKSGHIYVNLSAADSERVYADDERIKLVETTTPRKHGDPFQWVLRDGRAALPAVDATDDEDQLIVEVTFVAEPATARAPQMVVRQRPAPPTPAPLPAKDAGKRGPSLSPRAPSAASEAPTARAPGLDAQATPQAAPRAASGPATARAAPAPELDGMFTGHDRGSDATPISSRYSLKLAGCALLRIDGDRALGGLEEWVVWLDPTGYPVQHENRHKVDTNTCLALAGTAKSRSLYYRLAGETNFKPVKLIPCVLPTETGKLLELKESPLPGIYHGMLMLPQETSFPLSPSWLVLGRSNLQPEAAQPDLPLELLNHPHSLRWNAGGGTQGAKLNSLNLSRRHVSLRLVDGRLELAMAEGKMPVYTLDRNLKAMRSLDPGARATMSLRPDEYIVVGAYLLRFHQERPQTMLSREASRLNRAGAPPAA